MMDENIRIEYIDKDNYKQVIALRVNDDQKYYVSDNVRSLADCYLYKDDGVVPFAIKANSEVVGFCIIDIDSEEDDITIWRIMIDRNHQNKGYGRKAILEIFKWIKKNTKYRSVYIDYVIGNEQAKSLYEKIGFKDVRINEFGEQVMVIDL